MAIFKYCLSTPDKQPQQQKFSVTEQCHTQTKITLILKVMRETDYSDTSRHSARHPFNKLRN